MKQEPGRRQLGIPVLQGGEDVKLANSITPYLVLAALFIMFGLVGTMEYQDELKEVENYEKMVCNGHWPNYKNIELNCNSNIH